MDARSRIRRAWPADAPVLAALERRCFPDPWSTESFREALGSPGVVALIREDDGEVTGYLLGREILGTGEVLNLAVAPERRRQGIGRALLEQAIEEIVARGGHEVFLEVRASNAAALELYQSMGFVLSGRRRHYYREPKEDALVLRAPVGPGERIG
jgi:ribosomal-protein-alanine N-acetyltransferase